MYNLKKNTYVVVEFTTLNGFMNGLYDSTIKQRLNFGSSPIIEIAAVKIKRGKISEHYTNFIALDGVKTENLSDNEEMGFYGLTLAHLIGAPSLQEAIEKFYIFARDCIILVRHKPSSYNTPFDIFQWYAKSFGYVFNNPVFGMSDLVQAAKVRELFEYKEKNVDCRDVLQIAENLDHTDFWPDTFADHNIFFNPNSEEPFDKGRNDPLSWALAFAQLFIAIADLEDEAENEDAGASFEEITLEKFDDDNTCPF